MMVEFSIVPIGKGASFSASLAKALEIVDKSSLTYRIGPMGTAHHIDDKVTSVEKKVGHPLKKLVSQ